MSRPIVIHGLDHLRAGLRAARGLGGGLTVTTAEGGAGLWGGSVFAAMIRAARAEFPEVALTAVLDCADQPGHALNALRHGARTLRFTGHPKARQALIDMGAELVDTSEPALDLMGLADPEAACRAWLTKEQNR